MYSFLRSVSAAFAALLLTFPTAHAAFPALALKLVSEGQLFGPTNISVANDGSGRLFVCDQFGQIRILQNGMLLPTPFLDIVSKIIPLTANYDERGLLGLAFHPGYTNPLSPGYRKFYVFYSSVSPNQRANPAALTVSNFAATNPCTVTTVAAHNLTTGNWVTISGVTGGTFTTPISGLHSITVVDATRFTVPVECTSNAGITGGSVARTFPAPVNSRTTISEFQVTANPNVADPLSERVLLSSDKPQFNHGGGQLEFGPDGFLYFSVGDGGGANDTNSGHTGASSPASLGNLGNGQDRTNLMGKILRIDPLGNNGPGGQYGIPPSNPFVGAGGGVREEIYAYGLRNVWRFSWDLGPGGTGRLFAADVGQNLVEEIDIIVPGGNYGWHAREGTFVFDPTLHTALISGGNVRGDFGLLALPGGATLIEPIAQYAHPTATIGTPPLPKLGISVAGGYVYRGSAIPALQGKYVFGDYSLTGSAAGGTANGIFLAIEETPPGSGTWTPVPTVLSVVGGNPIPSRLYAFGRDESGELYVATKTTTGPVQLDPVTGRPSGLIYKIVPPVTTNLPAIEPEKDNTIFSDGEPGTANGNSNGNGSFLFGGYASPNGFQARRALLTFSLAAVPAGSLVTAATVSLYCDKQAGSDPEAGVFNLHRLNAAWGEGFSNSDANTPGDGEPATIDDATWRLRLVTAPGLPPTGTAWTTPGGDYVTLPSASTTVGNPSLTPYAWTSTQNAQLAADVNAWLAAPATNLGWILIGPEGGGATAKRFGSRESIFDTQRPKLALTYASAPPLTHFETWRKNYFLVGEFVDPKGDREGDNIFNLIEYAFGFSPLASNLPPNAGLTIAAALADPNTIVTITFRRDPLATDLIYYLETGSDLIGWTIITQSLAGGVPTGSGYQSEVVIADPIRLVTSSLTLPTPAKHFVRLRITQQ